MTLEQLQSMSDAELNELAAVKVMGWEKRGMEGLILAPYYKGNEYTLYNTGTWNPTGDMNDAMNLLEQFNSYQITKSKSGFSHSELSYRAIVSKNQNVAYSDSKTRAITIAAILAKEE